MKKLFGRCYIRVAKNNTFIVIVDNETKHILAQGSCGYVSMTGPRKRMPYSMELLGKSIAEQCVEKNCRSVEVYLNSFVCKKVKGAIRGLMLGGLTVSCLEVHPKLSHNVVRLRKSKRR